MDARPAPVLSLWAAPGAPVREPPAAFAGMRRAEGVADSPREALARACGAFPGCDVWLLEAGIALPPALRERLAAAWAACHWDVLSPLDARWSPPADAVAWTWGEHASVAWAGWSPACSLWRGAALATGTDPDRIALAGGLLPCVAVNAGPRDAAPADPPAAVQRLRRAPATAGTADPARPALLHVLHAWGGGVERFARDLAAADTSRQHLFLMARGDHDLPPFGRRLALHADLNAPPLAEWSLSAPVADTAVASPEVAGLLSDLAARWNVGAVLVSSLVGHALDVLRTGLPTAWCAHDTYPFWPLLHDARDPAQGGFDREALARALAADSGEFVFAVRDAQAWWHLRERTLAALADAGAVLVAPSRFARDRLQAIAPVLAARPWHVIPHGQSPLPGAPAPARPPGAPLRVLVPGRLRGAKGQALLDALLPVLPEGVELVLLGGGHAATRYAGCSGVHIQCGYRLADLPGWVARLAPDMALLPSVAPETWSYTLSEMLAVRLPVLCADLGAPAERLRDTGAAQLVAPDATAFADALSALAADRRRLAAMRAAIGGIRLATPGDMASSWHEVLPMAPRGLSLPPIAADGLRALQGEIAAATLAQQKREAEAALRTQQSELDRRAEWATSLERSLRQAGALRTEADARAALAESRLAQARAATAAEDGRRALASDLEEAQVAIARLNEAIHNLDQQLAEAHGYYQRDSTDLARQRDVAIDQRDAALAALSRIQRSLPWRLSAPLRWLYRKGRGQLLAWAYDLKHALSLASRGLASLRARGLRGTWRRLRERRGQRLARPSAMPPSLPSGGSGALRLPRHAKPVASVIVPVYGHLPLTLACLRALADCGDATPFEVIVVDDASPDDSHRVLPSIPGLRYLRNPRNLGFIGASNAGAELASGEFLVFLNNDTTVRPGWLDALLRTFATHPDTGLAGSRLVYPDGRLQEAGGIVFSDGSCWNYGRFDDPDHPRYGHVREVDYCSGAAIAVRRSLFLDLHGFDVHFAPAYYEDTDLAMRVRERGLKVRYQPASVVVHHEGATSGTDTASGTKAYQRVNQRKFLERWRDVLAAGHPRTGTDPDLAARHRARRQVLVLDACTPTPDRDSGSMRMVALMRLLVEEDCSVAFFPDNLAHDGGYTRALQQAGVEAWWHPALADVPGWLAREGRRFDLIIASRHYVLSPLLPLLRTYAPRAHLVFDTVDLHHLREQREAELSGDPGKRRGADRTRRNELALIEKADTTWVVSPAERELLAQEAPQARVQVVSNIHEVHGPGPGRHERTGLLFVGSYRHPPNVDAALWLADEIFPRIRARLPAVPLHLVGAEAPPSVQALGARDGITFHGFVPDLGPLLDGARVALAPLRYGAGVKGKVNQSLAHGQPVVATPCAVEGMHLRDGEDVLVAADAEAFADAVVRLYEDDALWRQLAQGGLENTRRYFSPEVVREPLRELLGRLPRR